MDDVLIDVAHTSFPPSPLPALHMEPPIFQCCFRSTAPRLLPHPSLINLVIILPCISGLSHSIYTHLPYLAPTTHMQQKRQRRSRKGSFRKPINFQQLQQRLQRAINPDESQYLSYIPAPVAKILHLVARVALPPLSLVRWMVGLYLKALLAFYSATVKVVVMPVAIGSRVAKAMQGSTSSRKVRNERSSGEFHSIAYDPKVPCITPLSSHSTPPMVVCRPTRTCTESKVPIVVTATKVQPKCARISTVLGTLVTN